MRVSITGHRPERILDPEIIKESLRDAFITLGATVVIQGLASGVDLWAARQAYELDIPFWCVKPWDGHNPRANDRVEYSKAIQHCSKIVTVVPATAYPGPWVYQRRNEWMVDNSEVLLSVFDGVIGGGTFNCVEYARKKEKDVYNINPTTGGLSLG